MRYPSIAPSTEFETAASRPAHSLIRPCSYPFLRAASVDDLGKLVYHLVLDILFKYVHLGLVKLARGDLLLKQDVQLGKGASAGFRQAEESVDDAEEADGGL